MKPLKLVMQAFGPFAAKEVIDFKRLGENPLFLINGVTGSGKSSILDAICFALYGQTTDESRDGSSMRCDYSDDALLTELIFDFSLGDYQYRIRRIPTQYQKKKRGDGTTQKQTEAQLWRAPLSAFGESLFESDASELLVAKKVNEANSYINSITGLSVDQFRQVMVLPQGKFRELLLADSKDREAIFSQLFQTQIYKRIEDKLKEQSASIRREREQLHNQVQGLLDSANFNERAQLDEELAQLKPELAQQDSLLQSARSNQKSAQRAVDSALQLQARFKSQQNLLLQQENLQKKKIQIDVVAKKLAESLKAEELKPLQERQAVAEVKKQECSQSIAQQENNLQQLQSEFTEVEQRYTQAQTDALEIEALQRQQQELLRVQLQVEKLQGAQHQVTQFQQVLQRVESDYAQQQQDIAAMLAVISEYDLGNQAKRQQLQKLPELVQQLTVLAEMGKKLARLQELNRDSENIIQSQHALNIEISKQQSALTAQQTTLTQTELQWHQGQAAILAQQLGGGDACPVCGSCEHPNLAHLRADALNKLVSKEQVDSERQKTSQCEKQLQLLQQELYGLQQKQESQQQVIADVVVALGDDANLSVEDMRARYAVLKAESAKLESIEQALPQQEAALVVKKQQLEMLQVQLEETRQTLESTRQQLAVAGEKLSSYEKDVDKEYRVVGVLATKLAQVKAGVEVLQRNLQASQSEYQRVNNLLISCDAALKAQHQQHVSLTQELTQSLEAWQQALAKSEFSDASIYRQALLSAAERQALRNSIDAFERESNELSGQLKQLHAELDGLQWPELEPLQVALQEIEIELDVIDGKYTQLLGRNKQLLELKQKLEQSRVASERLDERYAVFGTLSDVANGVSGNKISLQRFVLSVLLDDVLIQATERLQIMSQGRYQLLRKEDRAKGNKASGLELEVEDSYTGKSRSVATLSGGESFMAALAMALGLSDVVQAYSGGIKLDTLFIDEGFGSLDPESLELALRTLVDLQMSGRTIGIISHVTELKEQMAQRIDVVASRGGSSVTVRVT